MTDGSGATLCTLGTYSTSWSASWPDVSCTFALSSGPATVTHETGESYYYELTVTLTDLSGTTSDISPTSSSLETLATLTDLSVTSGQAGDACATGDLGWTQSSTTDHDTDGCQDSNEDTDDDNDGVADTADSCATCLLYTSPSPRDKRQSRMPSSA